MKINVKRVYEKPDITDGTRILVDRLWPRGLSKEDAKIDLWFKSIAPSTELRKWYHHDPEKWNEFKRRYFSELNQNQNIVTDYLSEIKNNIVTFLYATKEVRFNSAIALKEFLENIMRTSEFF